MCVSEKMHIQQTVRGVNLTLSSGGTLNLSLSADLLLNSAGLEFISIYSKLSQITFNFLSTSCCHVTITQHASKTYTLDKSFG